MTGGQTKLPAWVRQSDADVALEWGPHGMRALAPGADAVVVFDVLRFTTAVDVAVAAGLRVLAHRWDRDEDAAALAERTGAVLAAKGGPGPSLSPGSLRGLPDRDAADPSVAEWLRADRRRSYDGSHDRDRRLPPQCRRSG